MVIYSHSRLSTYEQCPYKFKLKYIDRIEPELKNTIEAFLGSRVHETLEWLYRKVKMGKIPTLDQTLDYYGESWRDLLPEKIRIVREEYSAKDYFKKGKEYLKKYYKSYHPFDENVIATEERVVIDLDESGKYKLQGFIDRLDYNEEEKEYEIHDYKTSSSLKTQENLDQDRQLALYSLAIKERYPDAKKICLSWHFLAFDKEFCSYRSKEDLEKLKKDTIELIKEIESNKEWPARESSLCNWCEYRKQCPKFKHLYQKEEKKDEKIGDGTKLVEKYAELSKKRKEIKAEMEILREAITHYAKMNNLDVLFGEDNKVKIKFSKKFKIPGKKTKERKELKQLLRNLKKWNEVSDIDRFKMNKIMLNKKWPKEVLEKIGKFGKFEESSRLSVSKRKKDKSG